MTAVTGGNELSMCSAAITKQKQTNKQETNMRYELIPLKQNANSLNLAKCKKDGISWSNKF